MMCITWQCPEPRNSKEVKGQWNGKQKQHEREDIRRAALFLLILRPRLLADCVKFGWVSRNDLCMDNKTSCMQHGKFGLSRSQGFKAETSSTARDPIRGQTALEGEATRTETARKAGPYALGLEQGRLLNNNENLAMDMCERRDSNRMNHIP